MKLRELIDILAKEDSLRVCEEGTENYIGLVTDYTMKFYKDFVLDSEVVQIGCLGQLNELGVLVRLPNDPSK